MAALQKAAAALNRGKPSSFYETSGKVPNPVYQKLKQELALVETKIRRRAAQLNSRTSPKSIGEYANKIDEALFEIWNNFENRVPQSYIQQQMLEFGDFLICLGEYSLALHQCYERYLIKWFPIAAHDEQEQVLGYLAANGTKDESSIFAIRALMGRSIGLFHIIQTNDPRLLSHKSVTQCLEQLYFLRSIMQLFISDDTQCWLVYNGTVYIYKIARCLMNLGHSSKVVEFLLWSCVCMETSLPLNAVKYLTWRSTLYTATCQCYYDIKLSHMGEAFARRALAKISELSQLEQMSNCPGSKEEEAAFRAATIRMAVMVYKRAVVEMRRKSKDILKPKTRINFKEIVQLAWPRTASEKLLASMFDCSSAQALALIEVLSDTNRRTLLCLLPSDESDVEVLDLYIELFLSAQGIIAGGGGSTVKKNVDIGVLQSLKLDIPNMGGIVPEQSLMDMAIRGENGITLSGVVRLIKSAYCYQQWDFFDNLLPKTLEAIQIIQDGRLGPCEVMLKLLKAYDKAVPRPRAVVTQVGGKDKSKKGKTKNVPKEEESPPPPVEIEDKMSPIDRYLCLGSLLSYVASGPYKPCDLDVDIIIDICTFLWNKCRLQFQRYQAGTIQQSRYLEKMDDYKKWISLLDAVHEAISWCEFGSVDAPLAAEVALRLALAHEACAYIQPAPSNNNGSPVQRIASRSTAVCDETAAVIQNSTGHVTTHLQRAEQVLVQGLSNISAARNVMARANDGLSIADFTCAKNYNPDLTPRDIADNKADDGALDSKSLVREALIAEVSTNTSPTNASPTQERKSGAGSKNDTLVDLPVQDKPEPMVVDVNSKLICLGRDLHTDMLFHYHRIAIKLAGLVDTNAPTTKPPRTVGASSTLKGTGPPGKEESSVDSSTTSSDGRHNKLSLSLLSMQRALHFANTGCSVQEQRRHLDESLSYLKRAEADEVALYEAHILPSASAVSTDVQSSAVPPAPILLSRTETSMVFKPASFLPASGEQVSWYSLLGKAVCGSSFKARLNDCHLPGTGVQVSAKFEEIQVTGLTPGEKYVFAIAAYSADGQLIGGGIGQSTKPILASHPMSIVMAWSLLCQVAFQIGYNRLASEAFNILWSQFVFEPLQPASLFCYSSNAAQDVKLKLHKLNQRVVSNASVVLLRSVLYGLFAGVESSVNDLRLFCTTLSENGPLKLGQMQRIELCEKMIPIMELSGILNDHGMALQAVVRCYGLLTPLLYHKVPSLKTIQVLESCIAVMQEMPPSVRVKKGLRGATESITHMTACMVYHLTKMFRKRGEDALAAMFISISARLLSPTYDPAAVVVAAAPMNGKKGATTTAPVLQAAESEKQNQETSALASHASDVCNKSTSPPELTGNEDLSVLYGYITCLPSQVAYLQVKKFKKRGPRFLEYLIQVAEKGLAEGIPEVVLLWCSEAAEILISNDPQSSAVAGAGASTLTQRSKAGINTSLTDALAPVSMRGPIRPFQAVIAEFVEEAPTKGASKATGEEKREFAEKKDAVRAASMNEAQKQTRAQRKQLAMQVLQYHFIMLNETLKARRRFRQACNEERPWRSQMNVVLGFTHLSLLLKTIRSLNSTAFNYQLRASCLDREWFTLETASCLLGDCRVTGYNPFRMDAARDITKSPSDQSSQPKKDGKGGKKGAAVAAPPPEDDGKLPLLAIEVAASRLIVESAAPLTSKDDKGSKGGSARGKKTKEEEPAAPVLPLRDEIITGLQNTFYYFKKAIVLAHRGQHWTQLQNTCKDVWNSVHLSLAAIFATDQRGNDMIDLATFRFLICDLMTTASNCLLDMIKQTQQQLAQQQQKRQKQSNVHREAPAKGKAKLMNQRGNTDLLLDKSNTLWLGTASDERGGADLRFDVPFDDVTTIDIRSVKRVVLYAMEVMYHCSKWETLVSTGLHLNALSRYRWTEVVSPLIVKAQYKLIERIAETGGPPAPQPHFKYFMDCNGGRPITAEEFISLTRLNISLFETLDDKPAEVQLRINVTTLEESEINQRALQLCCVPLDINQSLVSWRDAVHEISYTARALQHCRRLMILYLAGQSTTSSLLPGLSEIEEEAHSAMPQDMSPMPLDVEMLLHLDVEHYAINTLATVISAYEKTIELLEGQKEKGLRAEAMRELGNIHFHNKNPGAALKYWTDALDLLMGAKDYLNQWRCLPRSLNVSQVAGDGQRDFPQEMLDRAGIWGCLVSGILASNIAQYSMTKDLPRRTECCFLARNCFMALFRSSLPHPSCDRDYASYDIGEDYSVNYILPGIDIMSDRYRCDGRTVVNALTFVAEQFVRGHHYLAALPVLVLQQYWTTYICRDLSSTVRGLLLRLQALTNLGFFTEAIASLQALMNGERLPQPISSGYRLSEPALKLAAFNCRQPIVEPSNQAVLECIAEKRMTSNVSSLYGPHLTCQVSLAQAHLLVSIAATVQAIPVKSLQPLAELSDKGQPPTLEKGKGKKENTNLNAKGNSTNMAASYDSSQGSGDVNMDKATDLKQFLLARADRILTLIVDSVTETAKLQKGMEYLSSSELELVILAKLEQAAVAGQLHHAAMAARIVISAMKIIQASVILNPTTAGSKPLNKANKKIVQSETQRSVVGVTDGAALNPVPINATDGNPADPNNSNEKQLALARLESARKVQYQPINSQSRARLDDRLWLLCRLALVKCLSWEVKGMGKIAGVEQQVKIELSSVDEYCKAGLQEAETASDIDMQAEFLLCGVQLQIFNGKPAQTMIVVLQEIEKMLIGQHELSLTSVQVLVQALVHKTDLQTLLGSEDALGKYVSVQKILLAQLQCLGETKEERSDGLIQFSSVASPISNIYLPLFSALVDIKMRIGLCMTEMAIHSLQNFCSLEPDRVHNEWMNAADVHLEAVLLSNVIAARNLTTEANLLFNLGLVERQLYALDNGRFCEAEVCKTLLAAIKMSCANENDLSLIGRAYMELALVYLKNIGLPDETTLSIKSSSTSEKMKRDAEEQAWIAVRCAAAASMAQTARVQLAGDNPAMLETVGTGQALKDLPHFVSLDLIGSNLLGTKKTAHRDDIDAETATLIDNLDPPVPETYDDQLNRVKDAISVINWLSIAGYQNVLKRLSNLNTISMIQSDEKNQTSQEKLSKVPSNDISRSRASLHDSDSIHVIESTITSRTASVSSLKIKLSIFSSPWSLRLAAMHRYLSLYLPVYAQTCCAVFPPKQLDLVKAEGHVSQNKLDDVSGEQSNMPKASQLKFVENRFMELSTDASVTARFDEQIRKCGDNAILSLKDTQVTVVWCPSLAEKSEIYLMFSAFSKSKRDTGLVQLSALQLGFIHQKLKKLWQQESLMGKVESESGKRPSKGTSTNSENPIQIAMNECLTELSSLLSTNTTFKLKNVSGSVRPSVTSLQVSDLKRRGSRSKSISSFNVSSLTADKLTLQVLERFLDTSCASNINSVDVASWLIALLKA